MQELAPIHDSTPRDHGRTIGGYELFTGLSASGSAKQHNGDVYNNNTSYQYTVAEQRSDDALQPSPRDLALLRASFEGQVIRIRHLLDLHADVDYRDGNGLTALHHAIFGGFEDAVQLLLDRGADANAYSPVAAAPLHLAVLKGRGNVAKLLISRYRAASNAVDPDLVTPLHSAVFAGDVEIAGTMLKHGAEADLECAVDSSKQKWISSSAPGDKAVSDQSASSYPFTHATPPLVAILSNQETMAKFLVQSGSSINQPSKISIEGFSEHLPASLYPLHLVASRGLSSLLDHFLADETTHRDVQDFFGNTALHCACSAGHTGVAVQLLEAGASPDMVSRSGQTALHAVAARSGRVQLVQALCSHDATINAVNSEGETPLQLAEKAGNSDAAAEILRQVAIQNRTGSLATTTTTTAAADR